MHRTKLINVALIALFIATALLAITYNQQKNYNDKSSPIKREGTPILSMSTKRNSLHLRGLGKRNNNGKISKSAKTGKQSKRSKHPKRGKRLASKSRKRKNMFNHRSSTDENTSKEEDRPTSSPTSGSTPTIGTETTISPTPPPPLPTYPPISGVTTPEPTLDPPTPFTCPIDIPDGSVGEDGTCCEPEDCKSGLSCYTKSAYCDDGTFPSFKITCAEDNTCDPSNGTFRNNRDCNGGQCFEYAISRCATPTIGMCICLGNCDPPTSSPTSSQAPSESVAPSGPDSNMPSPAPSESVAPSDSSKPSVAPSTTPQMIIVKATNYKKSIFFSPIVRIPVDCSGCTVKNVAVDVGIERMSIGQLKLSLVAPSSPDGGERFTDLKRVNLVYEPQGDIDSSVGGDRSSLSKDNLITFDDSAADAMDPQSMGIGVEKFEPIPAGTFYAQGNNRKWDYRGPATPSVYPNEYGLKSFNGQSAEGSWFFKVDGNFMEGTYEGTIESIELRITCEEEEITCTSLAPSESSKPSTLLRPTSEPTSNPTQEPSHEPTSEPTTLQPTTKITIKGTETPKLIPDGVNFCDQCTGSFLSKGCSICDIKGGTLLEPGPPAPVPLPVDIEEDCTVENVAIDIAIEHERVGDLTMRLFSPDGGEVVLVDEPGSSANLVPGNTITFDDSFSGAKDPQTLGDDVDANDDILAGTFFARRTRKNPEGLGKFNGMEAEGEWVFTATDNIQNAIGVIASVELELEITCEDPKPSEYPSSSPAPSESSKPSTLLRPTHNPTQDPPGCITSLLTALAGETQPITLIDDIQYIYTAKITTSPLGIEFAQANIGTFNANIGTLSSIDECGEILFDEGDSCGASIGPRGGRVIFTNIQTDCTPSGLETTTISVSEGPICFYEFTVEGFCCPNYDESSCTETTTTSTGATITSTEGVVTPLPPTPPTPTPPSSPTAFTCPASIPACSLSEGDDCCDTENCASGSRCETKSAFCRRFGAVDDCTRVCDLEQGFQNNPACDPGELCVFDNPKKCADPTPGTCTAFSKRTCSSLSDVQTRRLGKGLGKKRGWSETAEEENIPLN